MLALLFFVAIFTVIDCRVTFTHSEVLQQSDLDAANTATFKCANGCLVYSDSDSLEMFINDGTQDLNNFRVMYPPDKPVPTELVPWNNYKLVYRGAGTPPPFVFYVVDKLSPNRDTTVYAVNQEHAYAAVATGSRRFTVLNSVGTDVLITFSGDFPKSGYPRIYTTGYDATSEDACRPVYQARSSLSAANSFLSIPSPILTVDKGTSDAKMNGKESATFVNRMTNSSVVYMSSGYVGCSYNSDQTYFRYTNMVMDTISSEAKNLDIDSSVSIPSENEGVHVTVNNKLVDLYGNSIIQQHYEADRFDVTISWIRNTPASYFALQIDLGIPQSLIPQNDDTATPKSLDVTTSEGAPVPFIVNFLLTVLCVTWTR